MTEHLDEAVNQAKLLHERIKDTQDFEHSVKVTEDEIEIRVGKILSAVRRHNDQLAEEEMQE